MDNERAELLAAHGALTMSMRWFGGDDQPNTPAEVPLESFIEALTVLSAESDRLAIVGSSFGAEAALSVASRHPTVDAVVALSPTAYVWPGPDGDGGMTSHWTWQGAQLDFVPLDGSWVPTDDPPAFRGWYQQSLIADPDAAAAGLIPIRDFAGELVLVAGEDDQVWPAADWAREISRDRDNADLSTILVTHPEAGHRVVLPGEQPVTRGQAMMRGGTLEADASLGLFAWPHIVRCLALNVERAATG